MEKVKILHVASEIEGGGIERVIYNYLSHINRNDFIFHIAVIGNGKKQYMHKAFEKLGAKIFYMPLGLLNRLKIFNSILKDEKYNIIHCHGIMSPVYYSFLAKKNNIPVRISHSHIAQSDRFNIKVLIARALISKYVTNKFSCGYAAGEFLYGKKAMLNKKVYVLNNAIEVTNYVYNPIKRDNIRKKMNLEKSFIVGNVARFTSQKNHDFLIDIFKHLKQLRKDAILLLVGEGELESRIKNKVRELKLEDSIIFLGLRDDVNDLMQAMDIFLLPSFYEGLSVAMVEAQATGLPIFTSTFVSKDVNITGNVSFLPLNNNTNYWGSFILRYMSKYKRDDMTNIITVNGFNINERAKYLENIYKKLAHANIR